MADPRPSIRRTPTINREMAQVHECALRGKTDKRSTMISMFAFFATLCTLGAFVLANWSGWSSSSPNPVAEVAVVQEAAAKPEHSVARSVDTLPSGSVVHTSTNGWYDDVSSYGEPMDDWSDDAGGGWGDNTSSATLNVRGNTAAINN